MNCLRLWQDKEGQNAHMKPFPMVLAALLANSLLAWTKPTTKPSPFGEAKTAAKKTTKAPVMTMPASHLLEVNPATAGQLEELPGMGKSYAEKVIQDRPYRAQSGLVKKHFIPAKVHAKIRDRIIARRK